MITEKTMGRALMAIGILAVVYVVAMEFIPPNHPMAFFP
jgi:hypothetical protein